ncbi:hypothetical protein EV356DRAFT_98412 [Viridothelium virens]|uniref:Uncharacterized protein n=1 Tax=Viridothelium virens TaxID=1048519 RepID=A0A6A6HCY1_VIRVR|nr:hypothetical protein EV356DRAFT_98412 [Viridothelium virens]
MKWRLPFSYGPISLSRARAKSITTLCSSRWLKGTETIPSLIHIGASLGHLSYIEGAIVDGVAINGILQATAATSSSQELVGLNTMPKNTEVERKVNIVGKFSNEEEKG